MQINKLDNEWKCAMFRLILTVLFSILLLSGCGKSGDKKTAAGNRILNVVVTTGMLADAVERIGGVNFQVTTLVGPGEDPHLYKITGEDSARLTEADMVVCNGLNLEVGMTGILSEMSRSKAVIAAGELLPKDKLLSSPELKGRYDPHIWFDLDLWATLVEKLGRKIARTDLLLHDDYISNAAAYAAEVRALHWKVLDKILAVPKEKRVLVTARDAFGYFGRAYDVEVRSLSWLSTDTGYDSSNITELADFIIERGIKAIFVESSVPEDRIKAVQSVTEAKGYEVVIGGRLYSNGLGAKEGPAGNYLDMVRYNVRTIVGGLTR